MRILTNTGELARVLRRIGLANSDISAKMMAESMIGTSKKVQEEYEEKKFKVAMWNLGKEEKQEKPLLETIKKEEIIKEWEKKEVEEPKEELKRVEEREEPNHIESYNIPKEPSTPVINKTEEKREIKGIEIEPVDLTEVFNFSNR